MNFTSFSREDFAALLIGPKDQACDVCFIARYPSAAVFADMVRDATYREAMGIDRRRWELAPDAAWADGERGRL